MLANQLRQLRLMQPAGSRHQLGPPSVVQHWQQRPDAANDFIAALESALGRKAIQHSSLCSPEMWKPRLLILLLGGLVLRPSTPMLRGWRCLRIGTASSMAAEFFVGRRQLRRLLASPTSS